MPATAVTETRAITLPPGRTPPAFVVGRTASPPTSSLGPFVTLDPTGPGGRIPSDASDGADFFGIVAALVAIVVVVVVVRLVFRDRRPGGGQSRGPR
jgi:hypothetical protein